MSILDKRYLKLAEEFQWLAKKVGDKFAYLKYINILKDHEVNSAIWWKNIRTPSEIKFK